MTNHSSLSQKFARALSFAFILTLTSSFGARAATTNLTLAWNPNSEPELAGYRLYYGTASRVYPAQVPVNSLATNITVTNLQTGQTYYFAVTALGASGVESDYSSEISYAIPAVNTAPVANNQNVSTAEDTAKSVTLTGSDIDGDTLTYAVLTQPAHGSLSGTAPNLTYTPAANYNGSDSFTFRVNDGVANSATATVSITVTPVNDAPVAIAQSVVTLEDTAKAITLSGSDVDGNSLTFAVVAQPTKGTLSGTAPNLTYTPNANANGGDSFTFRVNDGTVNSATATVSISITPVNDAPVASAQSIVTDKNVAKAVTLSGSDVDGDALTYTVVTQPAKGVLSGTAPNLTYTPNNNATGTDSFTFRVNDGTVNSATATVSITINQVNATPVALAQSVTTAEDAAKAITLTGTDSDGDTLTYAVLTQPTKGTLSGTAPNLTYRPATNYNGSDSFTFRVNDGTTNSAAATVSITVTPVNDAPIANAQSVATLEDTAKAITLSGSDVDGDALTFAIVSPPTHGTLSGSAPNLTYTPAADYNGPDSFTFRVSDGTANSADATVSINVTPVNDAPVAVAQSVATAEDAAKAITLNGTDSDGDTLAYTVVAPPAHGTLSGAAPNVVYTPATNYNGSDSFIFKVNDGTIDSAPATVSITVTPVNDAPVANAVTVATERNVATAVTLTGSDVDGDTLTFAVVTQPAKGVLSGTAPNLTYTPNNNVTGTDSFTFRVNDGTLNSATATVSINISQGANTAPVASAQSVTTAEDTAKPITLGGSDADDDALTFAIVAAPAHGTLSGTAPNVTYAPTANFNGSDSFSFKANDGTADSAPAIVSITVSPVNDAPVASAQSVTTVEDTAKTITLTASDVDGDTLTFSIVTPPAHGTLSGVAPNLTYTPAADYSGADSFSFKVNDGTVDSASALVSINITAGNDAPVANAQSVTTAEDTAKAITLTGSDTDGDTLTFAVVTQPAHGTLSGTAPNLTYTPAADYSGSDSFTFRVNDGTVNSAAATVSITVTPANDAPVASAQSVTTVEDVAKAITLAGSDADGDTLTFSIVDAPSHGTLSGSAPNVTYAPATNYNGADSFTFRVNDGTTNSAVATVSITVTPANDAPVANAQSVTTTEDTAKAITLSATDADGDALTYSVVTQPSHGTLTGTAPNLTYTPTANFNGDDSFWFKATDGQADSSLVVVSISVTSVNDAPVANALAVATERNVAKAFTLTGSDVDGDTLTFAIVTQPTKGVLSGTAPNLTYTPNTDITGSDSFTFQVNDGTVDSAPATVSITVANGPNRAPTAVAQTVTTAEDTAKAISLSATDADGDALTYTVVTQPAQGTLSGTAPNVTYTPAANFNGSDSFWFKANDGTEDSALAVVSITVTPVNDAPVANAQSIAATAGTAKAIVLTGSDVDGDTLSFAIVTQPAHGTLTGQVPNLFYTPASGYSGADSFTFRVNDGIVNSAAATVAINVSAAPNTAPIASAQSVTTAEDTAKAITLAGTDADGDSLTFSIVTQPAHGALSGVAPNITYTPATNYYGADSFTFRASDGTVNSAAATVSINVTPVNDAPTLNALADKTVDANAGLQTVALSGISAGPNETQPLILTATSSNPGLIPTPTVNYASPSATGSLNFAPAADVTGTAIITVTVNDGQSQNNTTARSFTVTVNAVNSPITLDPIPDIAITDPAAKKTVPLSGISTTAESTSSSSYNTTPWLQSTLDRWNKKKVTLTVTASSSNTDVIPNPAVHYTSPDSTGSLDLTPVANASGTAMISVTVADGQNPPVTRSFAVTVIAGNQPPTLDPIADLTVLRDAGPRTVALTGISAGTGETQSLNIAVASSNPALIPTPALNYISPATTGSITFTPVTNASGTAIITVTVNDGQAENNTVTRAFTVTVPSENPDPAIVLTAPGINSSFTVPATINLAATVNAYGHTISKVQFFAGSTLVGEDSAAPYTTVWNGEETGSYQLVARALYESNGSVDSPAVTVSLTDLPAPWETVDVGNVATPGNASVENDLFTVAGAGLIGETDDSFRFVFQSLNADGEIVVNVASLPVTGANASAGIMIRETLTSPSRCVFLGKSPDGNLTLGSRSTTGGVMDQQRLTAGKPAAWLRLVRKGGVIVAFYGKKPGSWSTAGIINVGMASNVYIGMAVASGDAGTLDKAGFQSPVVVQ